MCFLHLNVFFYYSFGPYFDIGIDKKRKLACCKKKEPWPDTSGSMWFFQLKNQRCENLQHFCIKISQKELISSRNLCPTLFDSGEFDSRWHSCLLLWVLFGFFFRNFKKEGNIKVKTHFCLRELIFHHFLPFFVGWSKKMYILIKPIISGCYSKWQNLNIIILSCYQSWFTKIKREDATYSEHFPFKEVWP